MRRLFGSMLLGLMIVPVSFVDAEVITFFHPSTYSSDTTAMDQALGVDGFEIEDFNDTTLVDGLSIAYTGNGFNATRTSLTVVSNLGQSWDGGGEVNNHPDNPVPFSSQLPQRIPSILIRRSRHWDWSQWLPVT